MDISEISKPIFSNFGLLASKIFDLTLKDSEIKRHYFSLTFLCSVLRVTPEAP